MRSSFEKNQDQKMRSEPTDAQDQENDLRFRRKGTTTQFVSDSLATSQASSGYKTEGVIHIWIPSLRKKMQRCFTSMMTFGGALIEMNLKNCFVLTLNLYRKTPFDSSTRKETTTLILNIWFIRFPFGAWFPSLLTPFDTLWFLFCLIRKCIPTWHFEIFALM